MVPDIIPRYAGSKYTKRKMANYTVHDPKVHNGALNIPVCGAHSRKQRNRTHNNMFTLSKVFTMSRLEQK